MMGGMELFSFLERPRGTDTGTTVTASLSIRFCNAGFVGLPVIINLSHSDGDARTIAGLMMLVANALAITGQLTVRAARGSGRTAAPLSLPGHPGRCLPGIPLITPGVMIMLDMDSLRTSVTAISMTTGTAIFVAPLDRVCQAAPGQAGLSVAITDMLSLFSLTGKMSLPRLPGPLPEGVALSRSERSVSWI